MGKCSFSSNLSRMEGNKVHKAEDFFKYRASKPSKEFSFADCRFTEQYCYRHHIQNVVWDSYSSSLRAGDVMALPSDPNLNYVMLNNCAHVNDFRNIRKKDVVAWFMVQSRDVPRTDEEIMTINHAIPWPDQDANSTPREYNRKRYRSSQLCSCLQPFTTGMRRITTFRSTTDRIYDGGPIRL